MRRFCAGARSICSGAGVSAWGALSAQAAWGGPLHRLASISSASSALFAEKAGAHQPLPRHNTSEYTSIPQDRIRNFAIIAHIDHGKSTLADRLLMLTGAIPEGSRKQFLDRLPVERARGITVKAQSAAILLRRPNQPTHLLNLIDTPGHVDFSYEVARSLSACQGALLLVDATQGVQAQTLATFYAAMEANLAIIPVVNKVDMKNADVDRVEAQMARPGYTEYSCATRVPPARHLRVSAFGVEKSDILRISAKTGLGVPALLDALVTRVPPPGGSAEGLFRALLLDSDYDSYRGAVNVVQVVDGSVSLGERIESVATGEVVEIMEIGLLAPEPVPLLLDEKLRAGQVGYIISNARSVKGYRTGDTYRHAKSSAVPLPGFRPSKPMVFQGLFPASADEYESLKAAVERLSMNDPSVILSPEMSQALGPGFNAGFLGLLHADVFHQRLREEYGAEVIATVPTVPYRLAYPDGKITDIRGPSELPDSGSMEMKGADVQEPMVDATIICPKEAVGPLVELCVERRGTQLEHSFLDTDRVLLRYRLPMGEIAADFADVLKSRSTGYASFDYELAGYQSADIVRLDILLNGESVDALSSLVHREKAQRIGRALVSKLKEKIGRQMFDVIARESLSAMRKNVLAKCYGGDVSRKRKLLDKQKEGKKRMKRIGSVEVPHEAFGDILRGG